MGGRKIHKCSLGAKAMCNKSAQCSVGWEGDAKVRRGRDLEKPGVRDGVEGIVFGTRTMSAKKFLTFLTNDITLPHGEPSIRDGWKEMVERGRWEGLGRGR